MKKEMKNYKNIDEYISNFPKSVQQVLNKVRKVIKESAKGAKEAISYGIPTFKLNGNLVHFAAYKKHIGFYPGAKAISIFKKELSIYKLSKGTVQFQLDKPIPYEIIKKIVKYRVKENLKYKKD